MQANSVSEDGSRGEMGLFDDISGPSASEEEPMPCRRRVWWKVAVVLILVAVVAAAVVSKARRRGTPTSRPTAAGQDVQRREAPPIQTAGAQASQQMVLASVNGEEITLEQLEKSLARLPSQYQAAFEHEKHEFLEELIARKVLFQQARRLKVDQTELSQAPGGAQRDVGDKEQAMIEALLRTEVLDRVEVTEEDLRAFYEAHKEELPGDAPFDEVKDTLLPYAEQDKQGEAIESYVEDLRARATIVRDEAWVEQQKARAADNSLDRALMSGRPVLADFGRGVCIPCKMMKPILDDLAEEYQGRAEILIIEIDQEPALTRRCRIRVIPTQIFYDASGKEVYRHEGFMPREDIVAQLTRMGVP